jgi:predicted AAA+ superfamily ATPase
MKLASGLSRRAVDDGAPPGSFLLTGSAYAQRVGARPAHLRTWSGDREIDLIVERGHSIVAFEVKLGQVVDDRDVRHLLWLRDELGDDLVDAVVVTTGQAAYRRPDGIAVVPAALLGP